MCGHICTRLTLLCSSNAVTSETMLKLLHLPKPFTLLSLFFSPKVVPHANLSMAAFLHFPPFIPLSEMWLSCVTVGSVEKILCWIKQDRKCQQATGYKLLYYHDLLLCYRCCVGNMRCALRLLWAVIHSSTWFPLMISAAHVGWFGKGIHS